MVRNWIPIEKIQPIISYEPFIMCAVLIGLAYLFYRFFLKRLSTRRHRQLRHRFLMTTLFTSLSGLMSGLYWILYWQHLTDPFQQKLTNYLALLTVIIGAVSIIRVGQIYLYLYLFFSNISTGVPRLIVNLFTVVSSIIMFGILGSAIFDFNITTLATTSAVFSLVLGLALQDTLGNFFSGLALQIDRPFQINDWVEIQDGDQKWVGQIQEINWRATYLLSFADELLMIPNKTIGSSKILILTHNLRPVRLNQVFRFTFNTPIEKAKAALLEGVRGFPGIMTDPGPSTLVTETTESWITIKVYYSLENYSERYAIGDAVISKILGIIRRDGLELAHTTYKINS